MNAKHLCLFLIALAASSCAPHGEDLARRGLVRLEPVESRRAEFASVFVHRAEAGLLVHGTVRGRRSAAFPAHGHVDVALVRPDGEVAVAGRSSTMRLPRQRVGQSLKRRHFQVRLPADAEPGSTIRLEFHSVEHAES